MNHHALRRSNGFRKGLIVASTLVLVSGLEFKVSAESDELSPAQIVERLDEDDDGFITPDEIDDAPSSLRERLKDAGISFYESIGEDELEKKLQPRLEERREAAKSPTPPTSLGSSASAPTTAPSAPATNSSNPSTPSTTSRWSPSVTAKTGSPAVSKYSLPASYAAGDRDRDGQIGLYEWKAWRGRSSIAEFRALDRDGDGFLTPRELQSAPPPSAVVAAASAPVASTSVAPSMGDAATAAAPATTAAATVPIAANDEFSKAALRYFPLLDKDNDGKITQTEWQHSVRIRGMFQDAKIDISQPMTQTEFVGHYVRVSTAKK